MRTLFRAACVVAMVLNTACDDANTPEANAPRVSRTRVELPVPADTDNPDTAADGGVGENQGSDHDTHGSEAAPAPTGDQSDQADDNTPTAAPAPGSTGCRDGERKVGPVCVVQSVLHAGSRAYRVSDVYFEDDAAKRIVWSDVGYVKSATRQKLTVVQQRIEGAIDVVFVWSNDDHKFVETTKPESNPQRAGPRPREAAPKNPFQPG